jgi:hypothetical protein
VGQETYENNKQNAMERGLFCHENVGILCNVTLNKCTLTEYQISYKPENQACETIN